MQKNIRITVQYEGTRYSGWQKQGKTGETIQGKLEAILTRLSGAPVEVYGSGRTDGGVHAAGQVANFHISGDRTAAQWMDALNAALPQDIGVLTAEEVDPRFHARLNARQKTYCYRIHTGSVPDVFTRRYAWQHPAPLDVEAMAHGAEMLLGEHDFRSFCDLKKTKKSTVRRLDALSVTREGADVLLTFSGSGFLYHMVRLLTGTLTEVGEHRRLPGELPDILQACDRQKAGALAPACGLVLTAVRY